MVKHSIPIPRNKSDIETGCPYESARLLGPIKLCYSQHIFYVSNTHPSPGFISRSVAMFTKVAGLDLRHTTLCELCTRVVRNPLVDHFFLVPCLSGKTIWEKVLSTGFCRIWAAGPFLVGGR